MRIIIFAFLGSFLATALSGFIAYDILAARIAVVLAAAEKTLGPDDLSRLLDEGRDRGWYAPR